MIMSARLLYVLSALCAATAFTPASTTTTWTMTTTTTTSTRTTRTTRTSPFGIPEKKALHYQYRRRDTFLNSTPPKGGKGSSNSKDNDKDEYDVIVLYPKSEIPFFLQETPDGEAAFAGYVQYDQPCSTIKNVGDVLIAIDGEYVADKPIRQIVQIVQEKARNCAYSFLRFRSMASSSSSSSSNEEEEAAQLAPGQLPGEKRRNILEKKKATLEEQAATKKQEIDELLEQKRAKIAELDALDQRDLEWIEQQRLALTNPNRNFTAAAALHKPTASTTITDQLNSNNNNISNTKTQHYAFSQGTPTNNKTPSTTTSVTTNNAVETKPKWNVGGIGGLP